jgi:hypothetical protein
MKLNLMWLAKNRFSTYALALMAIAGSGTASADCGGSYSFQGYYVTTSATGGGSTTTNTHFILTGITYTSNPCQFNDSPGEQPEPSEPSIEAIKDNPAVCKKQGESCSAWADRIIKTVCEQKGQPARSWCEGDVEAEKHENCPTVSTCS